MFFFMSFFINMNFFFIFNNDEGNEMPKAMPYFKKLKVQENVDQSLVVGYCRKQQMKKDCREI